MIMFFRYYYTPRKEYDEDYEDDDDDAFLSPASTQEGVMQIHCPPFKSHIFALRKHYESPYKMINIFTYCFLTFFIV